MLIPIDPSQPIVDANGRPTQAFRAFLLELASSSLIEGTGSPEGIVEAKRGREYMDIAGVTSSIKYIKKYADIGGDRRLGWILI